MANTTHEYHAMFLLCLVLSLASDNELTGLSEDHDRIYSFGEVAKKGLDGANVFEVIGELRGVSDDVLSRYGFDSRGLDLFWDRLDQGVLPSHQIMEEFKNHGSMLEILHSRRPILSEQYV